MAVRVGGGFYSGRATHGGGQPSSRATGSRPITNNPSRTATPGTNSAGSPSSGMAAALKPSPNNTKPPATGVIYTLSQPTITPQPMYKSTYTAQGTYAVASVTTPQTSTQQATARGSAQSSPTALSMAGNFFGGVYDAGKETVKGIVNVVANPVQTAKGVAKAVTNPGETARAVKDAAVNTWNEFKTGDADEKSRIIGRLVGEVALAMVGTKGVDKAAKAVRAVDAVDAAGDLPKLHKLAEKAVKIVDDRGIRALTDKQKDALKAHPNLAPAFKGTAIDKEFKEFVKGDAKLRDKYIVTPQGKPGPDLIHKKTGEWVDLTTTKQAQKHINRYEPTYGKGHTVTYR